MTAVPPPHPPDGYVFIVTYGRSGSTLLQNLLNSIPGYQIRGENNNMLLYLAQAWHAVQSAPPMAGMRGLGKVSDATHPWFGAEQVWPDEVGEELAAAFLRSVLKPDAGVRVSGFKEIRFHQHPEFFTKYLNFIHRYFPRSRFVFNTRDHMSVARSGWWAERPFPEVSKVLMRTEALFDSYLQAYPGRGIRMHYDSYVASLGELERLYRFLGAEMDMEVVRRILDQRLEHARANPPGSAGSPD